MKTPKTYLIKEVASIIGVDKSTITRWIREGKVKDSTYRDGRRRHFTDEDITRLVIYRNRNNKQKSLF